ncbi:MAG: zinc ribbon domain-containing protein [Pseudomonadota bacterium]
MPVYQYRVVADAEGCDQCRETFELRQRISDDSLRHCEACGSPVERIISAPYVRGGDAHRLGESHLEKHGFTQYKRSGKGVYEKTAGKGPDLIADDGK